MSEKVLGVTEANRPAFAKLIQETLFLTPDRVIVARTTGGLGVMFGAVGGVIDYIKSRKKEKEYAELPLEDILKADKNNFSIPYSEITKVELKKGWLKQPKLNIKLKKKIHKHKKYEWNFMGLILPEKKGAKLEDYENMLRPIFGDKLSVKK